MGLMHNKALWVTLMSGTARFTDAQSLLRNELDGLAIDFTSDDRWASTGFYGDVAVKDRTTPANVYNNAPTLTNSSFLTYTSPSVKMTMGPSGTLRYQAHNLVVYSEDLTVSANWALITGTVVRTATTLEDNDGAAITVVRQSLTGLTTGATYDCVFHVGKDAVTSRFPEFRLTGSSTIVATQINTSTGAIANRAVVGTASSSVSDGGSYWILTLSMVSDATTGFVTICPAHSTTLGAAGSTAATGTVTVLRTHLRRTPSDSTYLATTTAARYALPLEWNSSGTLLGMRVEEARTNLVLQSNTFGTTWTASNLTNLTNTTTGPDGISTSAALLNENTATGEHGVQQGIAKAASAITYTLSVFAKAGVGRTRICLVGYSNGAPSLGNGTYAPFDLSGGQVGTLSNRGAGFAGSTATITALPNGLYRCTLTITTETATDLIFSILNDSGSGTATQSTNFTGTVGNGCYIYGAQLEAGAFQTSYIQTFASTVTRAADNGLTLATSAYPHSATVNTAMIEYVPFNVATAMVALRWDDGTSNEVVSIGHSAAAAIGLTVTDGGAAQTAPLTSGTATANATERIAVSWKANDFLLSDNGAAAAADTSGTLPTVTSLDFGPTLTGYIRKLVVLPVEKDAAEVAALATP